MELHIPITTFQQAFVIIKIKDFKNLSKLLKNMVLNQLDFSENK